MTFNNLLQTLLQVFHKIGDKSREVHVQKIKQKEEAERKRKEAIQKKQKEAEESNVSCISEVTDEEATQIQKEIDNEKYISIMMKLAESWCC